MKYTYIIERKKGCLTGQKRLLAPWSLNKTEERKQRSNFTFIAFPSFLTSPLWYCFSSLSFIFFISAASLRCHFHSIFQLIICSRWSGAAVYSGAARPMLDYSSNRLSMRTWCDTLWCHRYCILSAAGENAWWRSCKYEDDGEGASMDGWKI